MDKRGVSLLFFVVLFLGVFSFVSAESVGDVADSVQTQIDSGAQKIEDTKAILTSEEERDAYLKQRLTSLLENKIGFKEVISGYRKVSPYSDPILDYVVGVTPEFSLFFILVILLWYFFVKYYFTAYGILVDFSTFSHGTSLVITLAIFVILIVLQFFQGLSVFFANQLVALTELLTSPVGKVIAFVIFIVVIVLLSRFSKEVKVLANHIKKKREEANKESEDEARRMRQESATKSVEKYAEVLNED